MADEWDAFPDAPSAKGAGDPWSAFPDAPKPPQKGLYQRLSEGEFPALYNPKTANLLPRNPFQEGPSRKPPQMKGLDLPTFAEGMGEAPGVTLAGAAAPFAAGAAFRGTQGLGKTIFGKSVKDANLAQWFARAVATLGSERAAYEFLKHHFGWADGGRVEGRAEGGTVDDDLYSDPTLQSALAAQGPEQHPARLDLLRDALTPSYLRDTPSSPQADQVLADPSAQPGKIGPPSGPPTAAQIAGGLATDVGLNALPLGKTLGMAAPAFWDIKPLLAAKVDKLVAQGLSYQAISDETGLGKASIGRYLARTGQKTAATENLSSWTPGREAGLIADYNSGMSQPALAKKYNSTPGSIWSKLTSLGDAGKLDYIKRPPFFKESPERQARFIADVQTGYSQSELGRLHDIDSRTVGKWISYLREQGELQDYAPQGGTGLTPAGRIPTRSPLRFMQGEAPPVDPAYEKALRSYLGWKGGGRVMPTWWIKAKLKAKERKNAKDSRSVRGGGRSWSSRNGRTDGGPADAISVAGAAAPVDKDQSHKMEAAAVASLPLIRQDQALASSMTHWAEAANPTIEEAKRRLQRAHGGRIIGAKSQSEVGLAQNEAGTTFRCGTCKYFKKGECWNENPELHGRKVKPHWCCNLYDHAGMKVIA